jgi:hypothetical protein
MAVKRRACSNCGKQLQKPSISWNLHIKLWANYDGDIDYSEQSNQETDDMLEKVIQRIELIDQNALENEVYQEFRFTLCKDCRDIFAANPLNTPLVQPPEKE